MGAGIEQAPVEQGGMGAVLDVFNVLHEPTAVFNRIKQKPRILAPWLVISAFLMVSAYLTRPYQAAAMEAFRATLPPEQAARMGSGGDSILNLLGVPVVFWVGLAIGAGLLWIGVSLTGTQARYKTLMSVLAYSTVTYVLYSAVAIIVLKMRGVGAVTSFADLRAPLGLDLLAPNTGPYLGAILNGINPFSVWGVWLCGTGIAITHGISRATGMVVTAVAFLICLMLISIPFLFMGGS